MTTQLSHDDLESASMKDKHPLCAILYVID